MVGAIGCFGCLFVLLKVWRPAEMLGYGGMGTLPLPATPTLPLRAAR